MYEVLHVLYLQSPSHRSQFSMGGESRELAGRAADPLRPYPCEVLIFDVKELGFPSAGLCTDTAAKDSRNHVFVLFFLEAV